MRPFVELSLAWRVLLNVKSAVVWKLLENENGPDFLQRSSDVRVDLVELELGRVQSLLDAAPVVVHLVEHWTAVFNAFLSFT